MKEYKSDRQNSRNNHKAWKEGKQERRKDKAWEPFSPRDTSSDDKAL
jgi:hypothetical protein